MRTLHNKAEDLEGASYPRGSWLNGSVQWPLSLPAHALAVKPAHVTAVGGARDVCRLLGQLQRVSCESHELSIIVALECSLDTATSLLTHLFA
jgi:hypothetical protein